MRQFEVRHCVGQQPLQLFIHPDGGGFTVHIDWAIS